MPRFVQWFAAFAVAVLVLPVGADDDPVVDPDNGGPSTKADDSTDDTKADDGKTDDSKTDDSKTDDSKTDDSKTDDSKSDDGKGDDKKDDADGKGDDADEKPVDPLEEWDRLRKRKKEIADELAKLKAEFEGADRTRRGEIRTEFGGLVREYEIEIAIGMDDIAAEVLAKRPDEAEAAAILASEAFEKNRYARVLELAEIVDRAGPAVGYEFTAVRRLAAASHFALHEFEKAAELLEDVTEKAGWTSNDGLKKEALEKALAEYPELWTAEQAIREKEDALEGAERLPLVTLEIESEDNEPRGLVDILLFANEAPNTVASFVKTVKAGDYDGTDFGRVVANFYAPAGRLDDPVEWTIKSECFEENARRHFRGSVWMSHAGRDTGNTEFRISFVPTHRSNPKFVEGVPVSGHTVFGRVVKGMDVIDGLETGDRIVKATIAEGRRDPGAPVREGEEEEEKADPIPDDSKPDDDKSADPVKPIPDGPDPTDDDKDDDKAKDDAKDE